MPQNLTQIANSALIKLGANPVSVLTETSREARLVLERIVPVIHRVLRDHAWNFALQTVTLAPIAPSVPLSKWLYAFQIPPACLKMRSLHTTSDYPTQVTEYEIIGDRIYANLDSLFLRYTDQYIFNQESPVRFPDDFADTVAAFLAHEISPSLTSSLPLRDDLLSLANRNLSFARFNGAVEVPQYKLDDSSWLDSRLNWNGDNRSEYPLDA
jgi:hypothetical protein